MSRLPVADQVFPGSWIVDIHQEGHNLRSAPQRRKMAHLSLCSRCTSRKLSDWYRGGDKTHHTPGTVCSPSTRSPELLGPGKGTKRRLNHVCAFVQYPRTRTWEVHKTQGLLWTAPLQRNLKPEQCRPGTHTHCERGQTLCGPDTASAPHTRQGYLFVVFLPHTRQGYLFVVFLPPHSTTEQVSLNK